MQVQCRMGYWYGKVMGTTRHVNTEIGSFEFDIVASIDGLFGFPPFFCDK